jgi:hypothetical protein
MLSPYIHAALAHERHQALLARAETSRRARQARLHRLRDGTGTARRSPRRWRPAWLRPGPSRLFGHWPRSAVTGRPVVLRDGSTVMIRPVRPADAPPLADGFPVERPVPPAAVPDAEDGTVTSRAALLHRRRPPRPRGARRAESPRRARCRHCPLCPRRGRPADRRDRGHHHRRPAGSRARHRTDGSAVPVIRHHRLGVGAGLHVAGREGGWRSWTPVFTCR